MKFIKIILSLALNLMVLLVNAQSRFEVKDFGEFKLHSYVTANPLDEMSYIIEGKNKIVVLEPVSFFDNIKEFGEYVAKLNKPVEMVIVNYHAVGFSGFDHSKFIMVDGMPEFVKGDIYKDIMSNLAVNFGDSISDFVSSVTIEKNGSVNLAGTEFKFSPGVSTDFPASILIGGKAYYMHYSPIENMHMSTQQIPDRKAVDATLAELGHAEASGVSTFIGGHGIGVGDINAINFQIEYLKKVKETVSIIKTGDEFILVMQMIYPDIAGEDNLTALATNLYK